MDTDRVAADPRLMEKVPSLLSLTIGAVKRELLLGDDIVAHLNLLPSHLLDSLVNCLPPLALQRLQSGMPSNNDVDVDVDDDDADYDGYESAGDCVKVGQKRSRKGKYDRKWKLLFKNRWPRLFAHVHPCDWQQIYWETHLQCCLDEAAELASLPSFSGRLGDIKVSDSLLECIGCENWMKYSTSAYTRLYYHCRQFGFYARSLRLHNVFCVPESSQLLKICKLESLVMQWIRSAEHVDGLRNLLTNNCASLTSLEFLHCKISSSFADAVYSSFNIGNCEGHKIQKFSISTSNFLEMDSVGFAHGLASFLSSGRSLASLKLCDNNFDSVFARTFYSMLVNTSSTLSVLDFSENNISGWLSEISCRSSGLLSSSGECKSLPSLRVLNLRGNNLRVEDAANLRYALLQLPSLDVLDISDNPIEDRGVSCLLPYFTEDNGRYFCLSELKMENCCMRSYGVMELLRTLSSVKRPLTSLSIADNNVSHLVGAPLGRFLSTPILVLNIGGLGFGPEGFREMKNALMKNLKIVEINMSQNRGGAKAAKFLSKLLSSSPHLVKVNAAYNNMPGKSLTLICSALEAVKGRVECLDLTGNFWDCQQEHASKFTKFQHNGQPVVILPSQASPKVVYDDDP